MTTEMVIGIKINQKVEMLFFIIIYPSLGISGWWLFRTWKLRLDAKKKSLRVKKCLFEISQRNDSPGLSGL